MARIFLSASVPEIGRGDFHESADPFLIQLAVRELVVATIRESVLVWGGHPSITPMMWSVCEDLGASYAEHVTLFQSRYFEEDFPKENAYFSNVRFVKAHAAGREGSLRLLRSQMLRAEAFDLGVFVGGMEGLIEEFRLFTKLQHAARPLVLAATGGAARRLAMGEAEKFGTWSVDFAGTFRAVVRQLPERRR